MKTYSCDKCNTVFTNASNMRRHKRFFHSSEKKFKCERCNVMFTRSDHLRRHYRRHNRIVKVMYCGVRGCKRAFTHIDKLDIHRQLHLKKFEEDEIIVKGISVSKRVIDGLVRLVCPYEVCDKNFGSYSGIVKHMNTHLGPQENDQSKPGIVFTCDKCSLICKSIVGLERHIKVKHPSSEDSDPKLFFVCPHEGCRKIYTTRSNLNMHISRNHDNSIIFKCDDCGSSFKWKKSLNQHKCKASNQSL